MIEIKVKSEANRIILREHNQHRVLALSGLDQFPRRIGFGRFYLTGSVGGLFYLIFHLLEAQHRPQRNRHLRAVWALVAALLFRRGNSRLT